MHNIKIVGLPKAQKGQEISSCPKGYYYNTMFKTCLPITELTTLPQKEQAQLKASNKPIPKDKNYGKKVDPYETIIAKETAAKQSERNQDLAKRAGISAAAAAAIVSGGAALPYVAPALETTIAGVPGLTAGNLLNSYFAYEGAKNIPNVYNAWKQVGSKPTWSNIGNAAGQTAVTGLDMLPFGMSAYKGIPSVMQDINQAGEYLTTQTPLKNTYKLNPWALKQNPETFLYRAQPKGFNLEVNDLKRLENKLASGESLTDAEKSSLNYFQEDPRAKIHQELYGKWFFDDPKRLQPYIKDKLKEGEVEILKSKLPKNEADLYSVKNNIKASLVGNPYEYVLPSDIIKNAEKFSSSEIDNILRQHPKPNWLRGYKEVPKPTSAYEDYFRNIEANDKRLQDLLSSKKITYDDYLKQQELYKQELHKGLGLGEKLGSGTYGSVFELASDPSKVVKLGRPYGNRWTPELIESLKSVNQNANIAIPEKVQYFEIPSQWKGYGPTTQEVVNMPNLNKTAAENLNLSKRDRYAYFLKQARQLRDKGVMLDVENPENFKFNQSKNVFDIYDVNPGNINDPAAYMRYVKDKTQKRLLDNMMYKKGGVIKDDMGYWNPDNWGKPVEIGSNRITMQGVPYPVLGISDTGDTQMMFPGEEYKFKGKKVTEIPMAQKGKTLPPIYTEDPRKIRAYQDSLNLYRVGEAELKRFYDGDPGQSYGKIKNLQDLNKATKSYSGEIPKNQLYNTSRDLLNSKGNISKISSIYNRTGILPTEFWASQGSLNYRFKKPVQPYILQQEPQLDDVGNVQIQNVTGARPMSTNISVNQRHVGSMPPPQRGQYRVSYYNPEMKDWDEAVFMSQQESDQFANEMSQRGYSGSYGNVTQTKKYKSGGLTKYQSLGEVTGKNCRGKCWKPFLKDESNGSGGTGYISNAPVTVQELIASGREIANKKRIAQRTKELQEGFPGLSEDDVAMAIGDSARVGAKLWNFQNLDKNIGKYNELKGKSINEAHQYLPYSDYFYKFYRPQININPAGIPVPLTVPEILSAHSSPQGYRQTVQSNYKQEYGGPLKRFHQGKMTGPGIF